MRYLVSGYAQQLSKSIQFPFGTLAVNLMGCALVGLLAELADHRGVIPTEARSFLIVGILGGFTTFSAFSLDFATLWERGAHGAAITYVLASVVLSLLAVFLGLAIVRMAS